MLRRHQAESREGFAVRRSTASALRRWLDAFGRRVLSPAGVLAAGVCLSLGVCGIGSWGLYQEREDAYARAVENARNLLLLVQHDITRNIELYGLSLNAVAEGVGDPKVMALPPELRNGILFDRAAAARDLDGIQVLDERGKLLIDSNGRCRPGIDFSHDESFVMQRKAVGSALLISKPHIPRCGNGRPVISLSRPILRPDGSFAGVVTGALAIDYFRELLEGLHVGEHGTAAVIETNGALVARLPFDAKLVGRDLSRVDSFKKVMAADEGSFVGTASIDGTRKIYVFKRLAGLSIIVDVAPAEQDVYEQWQARVAFVGALMIAFCAIVITVSLLLSRELKQRADDQSRLYQLAHTDALTGLANRRKFDRIAQREWRRAVRLASPISLLLIDIDRFKALNDHYGHRFGDEVLRSVALTIERCARRPTDRVARYGGEEFAATLPDTDAAGALAVAERMREAVAGLVIRGPSGPLSVTVSVGIASWTIDAAGGRWPETIDTLIEQADQALYTAKAAGRNRVHVGNRENDLSPIYS
ncbi:diguanylate cyclase [Trinickia symbiotica]|uniref:diguanylate cyclase n=1 Tax=Trinickia symbiotica TaxID=863227 RepID=A0A2T3XX16_9BURK|nr:sensor domain-containing diguanylate cyclase [Trinickia symbiotica]PTB21044.1 diguanylate cyclase [Trinickia symbiotica]